MPMVRTLVEWRPALWALLTLPGLWLLAQWLAGIKTYGAMVSEAGTLSAQLLIFTLAITPLRLIFKRGKWLIWLVRRRRDFGVATFGYAGFHLVAYAIRKGGDLSAMLGEAADPWLLAGWAALLILLALALTSNDIAVRAMRLWWKRLHRLVYLAGALVAVHWVLAAFDPTSAYIYIGVIAALEAVRVGLQWRQRVT